MRPIGSLCLLAVAVLAHGLSAENCRRERFWASGPSSDASRSRSQWSSSSRPTSSGCSRIDSIPCSSTSIPCSSSSIPRSSTSIPRSSTSIPCSSSSSSCSSSSTSFPCSSISSTCSTSRSECDYVLQPSSSTCCECPSLSCSSSSADCDDILRAIYKQPPFRGLDYLRKVQAAVEATVAAYHASPELLGLAILEVAEQFGVRVRVSGATGRTSSTFLIGGPTGPVTDVGAMRVYALNTPTYYWEPLDGTVRYAFDTQAAGNAVYYLLEIIMQTTNAPQRQIRIKNSSLRPNGW